MPFVKKRPELVSRKAVVSRHDNSRPQTLLGTRQKLVQLRTRLSLVSLSSEFFHSFKIFDSDDDVKRRALSLFATEELSRARN